jgi:hypothetical protein
MRYPLLLSLLTVACAPAEPEALRIEATLAAPGTGAISCSSQPAACGYIKTQTYTDTMNQRKYAYVCAAWLAACTTPQPPPNPPPQPSAAGGTTGAGGATGAAGATPTPTTPEGLACANLAKLGCPEGQAADCEPTMALRCANAKVTCNTPCLVSARSKSDVQVVCGLACGSM